MASLLRSTLLLILLGSLPLLGQTRLQKNQIPAATVYTDQSNTFTTGTQDSSGVAATRPVKAGTSAGAPTSCLANIELYIKTDATPAGQQLFICNSAGNGWVLAGDGGAGGATHNLLSATHPDTLAGSPVLGDVLFANATPLWAKLAGNITSTKQFLSQTGTGAVSAAPAWGTIAAADVPSLDASKITTGTFADAFLANAYSGVGACAANTWASTLTRNAAPTCTQPAFPNLSGTAVKTQLPATTAYTDQPNTFGAFLQKFQAGANFQFADPVDTTKLGQFDLSGITTLTTRTVTVPNANSTFVVPDVGAANNFLTAISSTGVVSKAQPSFSNLSGAATKAQLPGTAVFTDQANTWSAGAQDFGAAASLKVPVAVGAAPTTSGLIAYDSTANAFKGGANLVSKTFAFTDSNITGTAANVTGIVAPANGGTGANNAATLGRYPRGDGTNFVTSAVAAGGAGSCTNQFIRAANDNAAPTCATVGATDVAIASPTSGQLSGVSSANLAAANKTLAKSIDLLVPATTDTNRVQLYFGQAVTITRIACSTDVGTVDINFDKRAEATPNTAGTNVMTANLQCTTTSGTQTTFASAGVAVDTPLNLQIAAVATAPNVVRIHVKATID